MQSFLVTFDGGKTAIVITPLNEGALYDMLTRKLWRVEFIEPLIGSPRRKTPHPS